MADDQLSAAEQRRQRILARRGARMAYAAGDRSIRPSHAPTESLPESGTHRDRHVPFESHQLPELSSLLAETQPPPMQADFSVNPYLPDRASALLHSHQGVSSNAPVAYVSPAVRSWLMVLIPVLYVLYIARAPSNLQAVSAVHVFLQLQILLNLQPLISFLASLLLKSRPSTSAPRGLLSKLSCIAAFASGLRTIQIDAAYFAFSFLVSLRVANLLGYLRPA